MSDALSQHLRDALARLLVRAWRITLDPVAVEVTLPMLRGVLGASLHDIHQPLYHALFEGQPHGTPGYLLRPVALPQEKGFAFEFVVFGPLNAEGMDVVWSAWDRAARRGLGPHREATRLREVQPLGADESLMPPGRGHAGFALAPLAWPLPSEQPCRLIFPTPVRLLREKRLISRPTLADLTIATLRRFEAQAPDAARVIWPQRHEWLEVARGVPAEPFEGGPCDLVRYSARQHAEVELRGVAGELVLPQGPGPLADLLRAATWLNLGKSTVQGMGQVQIASLD